MKFMIYILLLMLVISCEKNNKDHKTIFFENNTDYKVWVAYSLEYPDTITDPPGYLEIDPHSIRTLDEKIGYENLISQNNENRIILFVKKDEPYVIVKRYILTLDSLNALSWKITYP